MIPSDLCFARAVAPENQLCCDFVFASGHELDLLLHDFEFLSTWPRKTVIPFRLSVRQTSIFVLNLKRKCDKISPHDQHLSSKNHLQVPLEDCMAASLASFSVSRASSSSR